MSEETATFETFEDSGSDEGEFETFDDMKPIEEEEAPKKEKVKDDLKPLKDSSADSEGKVDKEDSDKKETKKKSESTKEKDDEDFEDEDTEEEDKETKDSDKDPEEKDSEEEKPKSKLRMRMGDELFNVESNATFKVKVDGETLDVPVQELINNYSGKTAWDKKFTEIGKEKKTLELEKGQLQRQSTELREHIGKVLEPLKDPNRNPIDSLLYLVELSGEDPYTAYRRIMEHNLEELGTLYDMSEVERELYLHKKKDELHSNVAKKRQERQTKEQTFNQAVQKVDALRQARNVTEEQFVEASEELDSIYEASGLDVNSITEEDVVDYASLRPHIATVKELVAPYEDNISDAKYGDVVAGLSRHLRDGSVGVEEIKSILKRNYSVEEDVKELNTKVYSAQKKKAASTKDLGEESSGFETFDDI